MSHGIITRKKECCVNQHVLKFPQFVFCFIRLPALEFVQLTCRRDILVFVNGLFWWTLISIWFLPCIRTNIRSINLIPSGFYWAVAGSYRFWRELAQIQWDHENSTQKVISITTCWIVALLFWNATETCRYKSLAVSSHLRPLVATSPLHTLPLRNPATVCLVWLSLDTSMEVINREKSQET